MAAKTLSQLPTEEAACRFAKCCRKVPPAPPCPPPFYGHSFIEDPFQQFSTTYDTVQVATDESTSKVSPTLHIKVNYTCLPDEAFVLRSSETFSAVSVTEDKFELHC